MSAQVTFINSLLNAAFRGGTYTGGTIKMALFKTSVPSTGGVELTGGSYARQTLTFAAPAAKKISTSAQAVFSNLSTTETVVAYGIYDGATLIDEGMLSTPYKADLSVSELKMSYSFELGV